jgi:hypothetical protein
MLAFVLGAFLAALRYRERPSTARAVVVALLIDGALLTKPALAFLACIAAAVLVVRERRTRDIVTAAAVALVGGFVVAAPFGLGRVWRQTVDYQLSSEREQSVFANLVKVVTTLTGRDVILLAFVALAIAAVVRGTRVPGAEAAADRVVVRWLWVWAGLVLAFLVLQPALWRNHISSAIVPLALLVSLRPPPLRWVAIAAIVAVPLHVAELRDILRPVPYGGPTKAAHEALEALPDGAWAISDEPGLVWRSHTRTPDEWVDASIKRQQQKQITAATITRTAASGRVCAVLVWSKSHWGSFPDLATRLHAVGYRPVERYFGQEGARVLYERAPCAPAGP